MYSPVFLAEQIRRKAQHDLTKQSEVLRLLWCFSNHDYMLDYVTYKHSLKKWLLSGKGLKCPITHPQLIIRF